MKPSSPTLALATLAAIILALGVISFIAGSPADCATYVKHYEANDAAYLPQPEVARERYERCRGRSEVP